MYQNDKKDMEGAGLTSRLNLLDPLFELQIEESVRRVSTYQGKRALQLLQLCDLLHQQ